MKKALVVICLILCNIKAFSSNQQVKASEFCVNLVDFPVTVNYEEYNVNDYNSNDMSRCEYPMVLHENITYIPLTYYNCILLGIDVRVKGDKVIIQKTNFENPAEYLRDQSSESNIEKTRIMTMSPFVVNIQSEDYIDAEYPMLFYKNIVYLPLTWNVVINIMQWDYSFCEKGITLNTDSYFYYSEGDSKYEIKKDGSLAADTPYGKTYYRKNGKEIFLEIYHMRIGGPADSNMTIYNGNNKITIHGFTGYGQKQGPLFSVDGNYVYTVHSNREINAPCKISINTGEIIYISVVKEE